MQAGDMEVEEVHDRAELDRQITRVLAAIDRKAGANQKVVAVTADHSTSCARKAHTADPVPLVVAGAGVPPDGCSAFGGARPRRQRRPGG